MFVKSLVQTPKRVKDGRYTKHPSIHLGSRKSLIPSLVSGSILEGKTTTERDEYSIKVVKDQKRKVKEDRRDIKVSKERELLESKNGSSNGSELKERRLENEDSLRSLLTQNRKHMKQMPSCDSESRNGSNPSEYR